MLLNSLIKFSHPNSSKFLKCFDNNLIGIRFLSSSIKIAVIGSGPAGFYTTQALLKNPNVKVDIHEKAAVPFGLIRFGVAPDHPEVKNVIASFNKIALNERVTFNGNIKIGKQVTLDQLRDAYNIVVLCYGSTEDRILNIEGEKLSCVLPAKRFVGWYNGVEEDKNLDFNLEVEDVVIIGQGNVALDGARILLTDVDTHLKSTDITDYALEKLKSSKVKNVHLIGRRGPLQVAFKIKEFREMTKINNLDIVIDDFKDLLPNDLNSLGRPRKRLAELMLDMLKREKNNNAKKLYINFLRSPMKIEKLCDSASRISLAVNEFVGDKHRENSKFKATDQIEYRDFGLLLRSIGYKAVSIDKLIPIDERTGVIENESGLIKSLGSDVFCCGWAATGANGVILGTMNSSFEIGKNILNNIENGAISLVEKPGRETIVELLKRHNVRVVTFKDWQRIDSFEQEKGKSKNKPREKIVNTSDILDFLNKN